MPRRARHLYKSGMAIPYVGQRMTREEFSDYLGSLKFTSFVPKFVTLHHTAAPTLAQRPVGFTNQHLLNLKHYYENTMGWSGAPHVFVDDQGDGIIVFQKMDRRGVHAASFNKNSWGVEMLGYYDFEAFDIGRGAKVRENSMHALAIMCDRLGVAADTIKFHRDDPQTSKTCPGRKVTKSYVVGAVGELLRKPDDGAEDFSDDWEIEMPSGSRWTNTRISNGRVTVRARDFLTALVPGSAPGMTSTKQVSWTFDGQTRLMPLAELDEDTSAWVAVRDVAKAADLKLSVQGFLVRLSR